MLFLDMSLDSTARTALETVMAQVKAEASAWLKQAPAQGQQGQQQGPSQGQQQGPSQGQQQGKDNPAAAAAAAFPKSSPSGASGSAAAAAGGAGGGAGAGVPAPRGLVVALQLVALAVENAALSSELLQQRGVTEDLCKALKWLHGLSKQGEEGSGLGVPPAPAPAPADAAADALDRHDLAMQVVAVVDRLKRCLSDEGAHLVTWLQVRGCC